MSINIFKKIIEIISGGNKADASENKNSEQSSAEAGASEKLNGEGKIIWSCSRYEGEIVNGVPHGKGKIIWNDGDIYEGNFVKGEKRGKGRYTYANGDVFEVKYQDMDKWIPLIGDDDVFDPPNEVGTGVYTYANGEAYYADVKDDETKIYLYRKIEK